VFTVPELLLLLHTWASNLPSLQTVSWLKLCAYDVDKYRQVDPDGMDLMLIEARTASSNGREKHDSLFVSVHGEVSVALCKGNHVILRGGTPKPVGVLVFLAMRCWLPLPTS
jgi:hypothetical protein